MPMEMAQRDILRSPGRLGVRIASDGDASKQRNPMDGDITRYLMERGDGDEIDDHGERVGGNPQCSLRPFR